jgi:translation initiation factor 2B subunit (eIF-2B alpha/beta/delta family)
MLQLQLSRLTGSADLACGTLLVDYTPPEYIEALFTDLMPSPLTTTQVTDELIKLYL